MKASEWIDQLKSTRGWDSDYRAAKELGVSRNTISNYRSKPDATMDDDTSCRVAEALGAAPEIIILDQVAERTKSEPAKAALTRALKRLGGAVAGVVLAAGLASPSPAPAAQAHDEVGGLRIMSNQGSGKRPVDGHRLSAQGNPSNAPETPHGCSQALRTLRPGQDYGRRPASAGMTVLISYRR